MFGPFQWIFKKLLHWHGMGLPFWDMRHLRDKLKLFDYIVLMGFSIINQLFSGSLCGNRHGNIHILSIPMELLPSAMHQKPWWSGSSHFGSRIFGDFFSWGNLLVGKTLCLAWLPILTYGLCVLFVDILTHLTFQNGKPSRIIHEYSISVQDEAPKWLQSLWLAGR